MALVYPTLYRRRITDVTVEELQRLGVAGILLDVDNTLTTHDNPAISDEVSAWLDMMRAAGMQPAVVSNNKEERVRPFADSIGLPYQAKAAKPLPRGYRAAARMLGLRTDECIVIGDQMFTDVMGANLCGMRSILLEPIEPETVQRFIVFKRHIERLLMLLPRQKRKREVDYHG